MSTKAEQIQTTADSLVTQCKAANTFAEVVGLGLSKVHGSALDAVIRKVSINPGQVDTEALDALAAYSEMIGAWVSELKAKAA